MNFADYFKGKKITVMGLGLLGRGVGDVSYLAEIGADLIVTDRKSEDELATSLEKLQDFSNIQYTLGEHKEEDFKERDIILVAPGVPMDSSYLETARENNRRLPAGRQARLVQSAALFAELAKIPIIGVTGTRGKSTVTQMIHHVLSVVTGEQILLGGNIRGVSNLQLLHQVKEDSLCVMELDSWQLQGWGWSEMSPQVAVFTNFMEDHLDYYQREGLSNEEAMALYFMDKANIFKYQEESGTFITTPEVFELAKGLQGVTLGQEVVLADGSVIPEDCLLAMPGEHNRLNAALAYEALKAVSLSDEEIFAGLASFGGVEGRLQFVTTINNVRIYNDNNATTPAATAAGLDGLDLGNKNIVLICGGADKGLNSFPLVEAIKKHCKTVVVLPGTGSERLVPKLSQTGKDPIVVANLREALEEARLAAENGDIILFSPGFASFGQYKNEYERNDEFMSLVEKL